MSEIESILPIVSWDVVGAEDVMSGLDTLRDLNSGHGRSLADDGHKFETYISWASAALVGAEGGGPDVERHCVEAALHSKRALDCLIGMYLRRDWLQLQLGPRSPFSQKLALLKERMGESLPWRLIPAVVGTPRDQAEHDYRPVSVEQAGVAVDAARTVVDALVARSDPRRGPAFVGSLLGGHSASGDNWRTWFDGFSGDGFALMWQGDDDVVRLGVGASTDRYTASIHFCELRTLTKRQHLSVLDWWDERGVGSFESEKLLRSRLRQAALDRPS